VRHHLARARSAALAPGGAAAAATASPRAVAEEVAAALRRLGGERGIEIGVEGDAALRVRADRQDLTERVGNLMENACKWATGRVVLRVLPVPGADRRGAPPRAAVVVEDDGPGLPPEAGAAAAGEALGRGARLDEAQPGAGLGLSIVADLVGLYGGHLALGRSAVLGGLSARLELPAAEALRAGSGRGDAAPPLG
jgi:signal transduction histidine kinase